MNLLLDTHVLLWWLDDPIDWILIAQALHEGFRLVNRDVEIAKFPVPQIVA